MSFTIPAVLAAAGASSRMGSAKPLLDAGGCTFLSRILGALRDGGARPVLVVVRDPQGEVASEARSHGGTVLGNPDPSPGPISSLQAGIRALEEDAPGVFFCPADHPLFLPTTVRALLTAFATRPALIVAPTYRGRRGHPVIFHRELFPELLEEGLHAGARVVVGRHASHRREVPVEDPGILADIDTPADYRRHFS